MAEEDTPRGRVEALDVVHLMDSHEMVFPPLRERLKGHVELHQLSGGSVQLLVNTSDVRPSEEFMDSMVGVHNRGRRRELGSFCWVRTLEALRCHGRGKSPCAMS